MKYNLKKNWDLVAMLILATSTAFGYASEIVGHKLQMYALLGVIVYHAFRMMK